MTFQVYDRLQKLSLCVSYRTLLRLLDKIGTDYDQEVKNWSNSLLSTIPDLIIDGVSSTNFMVTIFTVHGCKTLYNA